MKLNRVPAIYRQEGIHFILVTPPEAMKVLVDERAMWYVEGVIPNIICVFDLADDFRTSTNFHANPHVQSFAART